MYSSTSSWGPLRASARYLLAMLAASILFANSVSAEDTNTDASATADGSAPATDNACTLESEGEYDLGLHIGAIFILMGTSFLGTAVPLIGRYFFKGFSTHSLVFQSLKMFSTGVIICTAFIHMFLPATELLSDPCLPTGFIDSGYEAWAGVFAIAGLFATHLIQVFIRRTTHNFARKNEASVVAAASLENGAEHADDGHGHGHNLEYQMIQERHSTVYVLELGVASHSIIIGLILGFTRGDEFSALLIALCFHQFFEGTALSSVVVGARFGSIFPIAIMVAMYSLSTPLGVAIGVGIETVTTTAGVDIASQNLATGILEAFGAGILLYDALVNIMATHFAPSAPFASKPGVTASSSSSTIPANAVATIIPQEEKLLAAKTVQGRLLRTYEEDEHISREVSFVESSSVSQTVQIASLWLGALVMAVIGKWA